MAFKDLFERGGYVKCLGPLVHTDEELDKLKQGLQDVYDGKNMDLWREALRAMVKDLNAFAVEKNTLLDGTDSDLYTFWLRFVWRRKGCGYKLNKEVLEWLDDPERADEINIRCPKCGEKNFFREEKIIADHDN